MITMFRQALALTIVFACAVMASGQGIEKQLLDEETSNEESSSWYGESSSPVQMTPRMIIQQKVQMRAHQRIARMESLKWYGFSAARPLSSATPFAGVPSPRYEMPGGRPFAWYPYRGTSVVIVR